MRNNDISWAVFLVGLCIMLLIYVGFGYLHEVELVTRVKQYIGGLLFVLFMFALSLGTIRGRGAFARNPHPRFKDAKHPKPKLQILIVFPIVLLIIDAVSRNVQLT